MTYSIYNIQPLDCILFQGVTADSKLIMSTQREVIGVGNWSHVGIVVNRTCMPSLKVNDDDLYIYESNFPVPQVVDVERKRQIYGVQIRRLYDVFDYDFSQGYKIGICRLINNPFQKLKQETQQEYNTRILVVQNIMKSLHKKYKNTLYQFNVCRLFAAAFNGCCCFRENCCLGEDWVFCSQFTTIIYQHLGIFSNNIDCEQVLPDEICNPEISREHLPQCFHKLEYITK